ncbi:hypothetical protein TcasGA2_TC034338 [Tribolium castaneum]|uniref:Uncharacterized protein n=1 Tax=Tribolium castaneum TaxID=7070 RepID=A0A139WCN7_TRICA|nr:hypothetical protein TcasGA2_TC034338 [Tribolium castaneum]
MWQSWFGMEGSTATTSARPYWESFRLPSQSRADVKQIEGIFGQKKIIPEFHLDFKQTESE